MKNPEMMGTSPSSKALWVVLLLAAAAAAAAAAEEAGGGQATEVVSYDGRSLLINGERRMLFSGSIHYPRSTPQMWSDLIAKAKKGGLDVIQTYVFWNLHEPAPGHYYFEENCDLVAFLKEVQAQGLYACLRIGPYIESEWNYGGFPFWLHDVPGIEFRTNNEPFKFYMQNFTTKIVQLMKSEKLYASQGGPIILSQIENEYGTYEKGYHEEGVMYVKWAAQMAIGLDTGVPWIMCKQDDAPDPVINTCNGLNCGETFAGPNSPKKPALWTENWTSQYQVFGSDPKTRKVQDIAYAVALFIAKKNGSFVNYYMYYGGTNFGRKSASYVTTSYYDDAPIDEYGLVRQPKWGHLKELHAAIKLHEAPLLLGTPTYSSLGQFQEVYIFQGKSEGCVAFLVNTDKTNNTIVQFHGTSYSLPAHSISILGDCKDEIYNTAKVNIQRNVRSHVSSSQLSNDVWYGSVEPIPNYSDTHIRENSLLDQMSTTKDVSDYLWYTTSFNYDGNITEPVLHIESSAHVVYAFINGIFIGTEHGSFQSSGLQFEEPISLNDGKNQLALLSVLVGLPAGGSHLEKKSAGIQVVTIKGPNDTSHDLSNHPWGYQVGLLGGEMEAQKIRSSRKVKWTNVDDAKQQPSIWYKATIDAPEGNDPVALNFSSMGKGQAWVNGNHIGRYWVSFHTPSGKASQELYHVPRSFLKPKGNIVLLFEELGGDPSLISFVIVTISEVISDVSESNPPPMAIIKKLQGKKIKDLNPQMRLRCMRGKTISRIDFASFGNPTGVHGNYSTGSCHSKISKNIVEKACLGRRGCSIEVSKESFGGDPCPSIPKSLMVEAACN